MPRRYEDEKEEQKLEEKPEPTIQVVTSEQLVNLKLDRILEILSTKK